MDPAQIQLLQGMPIFGGISEATLEFLLQAAKITRVPKSKYFFHENDPGRSVFVLQQGRVAVMKLWKGTQQLLHHFEKGDCFGEMALMDFSPRSASVLAVEDSEAIEISSANLHELYKKDLQQFTLIQMNMGREVSRRLREADEQLFRIQSEAARVVANVFRMT